MTKQSGVEVSAGTTSILLTAPSSPWSPDTPNVPNVVPDAPASEPVKLERVDKDTLIKRPDLGADTYTLIVAGDEVPAALVGYPRRAVR